MKIILANGKELNPIVVEGSSKMVQGANRDCLFFVFPAETSLDELDGIFTPANCETVTVIDGEKEHIYSGYTVRDMLKRDLVRVSKETDIEPAVYENRVTVSMAQRTYQETQMAELQEALELILSGATGEEG